MIFENDLTVLIDGTEQSERLRDYNRDGVTSIITDAQFIHVGLFKPFNQLYWEFTAPNTVAATLTYEYFNGTAFVDLPFLRDDTQDSNIAWSRSGFKNWKTPDDWTKTTISGDDLFWVRFSPTVTTSSIGFRAINILFADDNDLEKENSTIARFLPTNAISFAPLHERVRDDIIQTLRNRGLAKTSDLSTQSLILLRNITKWDILDAEEIRNAAIYYALEKIYFQASDGTADKWMQRSVDSRKKGGDALNLFFLTIDKNDDGRVDPAEQLAPTRVIIDRV